MPPKNSSAVDIFDLLLDNGEKAGKPEKTQENTVRQELLAATKAKDLFPKGKITINKYTCVGVQCKLCIKACPTNALYWTTQGIGITEDLCIHCQACVLCCMVDNCIKITRKRPDCKDEQFSKTRDVVMVNEKLSGKNRFQRVREVLPSLEDYCKKYGYTKK
jgi:NAD-dependent dihydropyrimidine dehydrogenase PreA subunit